MRQWIAPALAAALAAGCTEKPAKVVDKYPTLPEREVPKYMEGTIYQMADLVNTEPQPISGYGLVTHLTATGGTNVANAVRSYMANELAKHDFGGLSSGLPAPDKVLDDPDVAIVKVEALIPPGARCGHDWATWMDVRVSILDDSDATSLAHGVLFETDLKIDGANPNDPNGAHVEVSGQAAGPVFVNPAYATSTPDESPAARDSLRVGVVMAGARVTADRPLVLRLRVPDRRMSRAMEQRIIQRFQDIVDDDLTPDFAESSAAAKKVANAMDEGRVNIYVPRAYSGNWQHFAQLVRFLYMQGGTPQFAALKADQLAKAASQPKANLTEISYCLEGLGKPALPSIYPLMNDRNPAVQYAAIRAAAFIGDPAALPSLLLIASTPGNPFRTNAVQTLGELPDTPQTNLAVQSLLDSDEATVRIAAYRMLADHRYSCVTSKRVVNGSHEVFSLDMIDSAGRPMIYCTRQGVPRLAVFGSHLLLDRPMLYTGLGGRLTIFCDGKSPTFKIVYRRPDTNQVVTAECGGNVAQVVDELAGDGRRGPHFLNLGYSEIVSVVQGLIDRRQISGPVGGGRELAMFVPQEPGTLIEAAPDGGGGGLIRPAGRPQSDHPDAPAPTDPAHSLLRDGRASLPIDPAPTRPQ